MEFQKKKLTAISQAIEALLNYKGVKNKKLIYTLVKNTKILEVEVEAIQKAFETDSEEYTEFTGKLREIYFKYGEVDEATGQLKTTGSGFVLKENTDKDIVQKEITELEDKYSKAIEDRTAEVKEYNEFLDETIELDLMMIKFEDLPEEISPKTVYILDDLITEPAE